MEPGPLWLLFVLYFGIAGWVGFWHGKVRVHLFGELSGCTARGVGALYLAVAAYGCSMAFPNGDGWKLVVLVGVILGLTLLLVRLSPAVKVKSKPELQRKVVLCARCSLGCGIWPFPVCTQCAAQAPRRLCMAEWSLWNEFFRRTSDTQPSQSCCLCLARPATVALCSPFCGQPEPLEVTHQFHGYLVAGNLRWQVCASCGVLESVEAGQTPDQLSVSWYIPGKGRVEAPEPCIAPSAEAKRAATMARRSQIAECEHSWELVSTLPTCEPPPRYRRSAPAQREHVWSRCGGRMSWCQRCGYTLAWLPVPHQEPPPRGMRRVLIDDYNWTILMYSAEVPYEDVERLGFADTSVVASGKLDGLVTSSATTVIPASGGDVQFDHSRREIRKGQDRLGAYADVKSVRLDCQWWRNETKHFTLMTYKPELVIQWNNDTQFRLEDEGFPRSFNEKRVVSITSWQKDFERSLKSMRAGFAGLAQASGLPFQDLTADGVPKHNLHSPI